MQQAPPSLMTRSAALEYLQVHLHLDDVSIERRLQDPRTYLEALTEITRAFSRTVPFQSISLLTASADERKYLPTFQKIVHDVHNRVGGCCYTLNVFMRELLQSLGLDTFYSVCVVLRR